MMMRPQARRRPGAGAGEVEAGADGLPACARPAKHRVEKKDPRQ